ncbi:hypothetical protein [Fertoeibacter niger]|uniref:hypothetical protein n=1 Tax=Fertoeibacter niger TaxID=2656921 RepID=UPI0030B9C154
MPNARSFSFFNILTHDPAIMAVSIEYKPDGTPKDTAANIRHRLPGRASNQRAAGSAATGSGPAWRARRRRRFRRCL